MDRHIIYCLLLLLTHVAAAQTESSIALAPRRDMDDALLNGEFDTYKRLFQTQYTISFLSNPNPSKTELNDTYFLAEILALTHHADSSITILKHLISNPDFDHCDAVLGSVAFDSLRQTSQLFIQLASACKIRLITAAKKFTKPELRVQLQALYVADQSNMLYNSSHIEKQTTETEKMCREIENIFTKYGYPSYKDVGSDVASIPTLILIHAPLQVQQQYKDIITTASANGLIPHGDAGIFLDKIEVATTKHQHYGTQYYLDKSNTVIFYPIIDSAGIEARRKKAGFDISFQDYRDFILSQYSSVNDLDFK